MNSLDRKFRHNIWYLNENWTVRKFLDEAAYSGNFFVNKKASRKQSDNLMDEINYNYVLVSDEGPGTFKLTEEQRLFFEERRAEYKRQWKEFITFLNEKYSIPSVLTLERYEEMKQGLLYVLDSIPDERGHEAIRARGHLMELINAAYYRDKIIDKTERDEAWRTARMALGKK